MLWVPRAHVMLRRALLSSWWHSVAQNCVFQALLQIYVGACWGVLVEAHWSWIVNWNQGLMLLSCMDFSVARQHTLSVSWHWCTRFRTSSSMWCCGSAQVYPWFVSPDSSLGQIIDSMKEICLVQFFGKHCTLFCFMIPDLSGNLMSFSWPAGYLCDFVYVAFHSYGLL